MLSDHKSTANSSEEVNPESPIIKSDQENEEAQRPYFQAPGGPKIYRDPVIIHIEDLDDEPDTVRIDLIDDEKKSDAKENKEAKHPSAFFTRKNNPIPRDESEQLTFKTGYKFGE
jgi:hypothetical protein